VSTSVGFKAPPAEAEKCIRIKKAKNRIESSTTSRYQQYAFYRAKATLSLNIRSFTCSANP